MFEKGTSIQKMSEIIHVLEIPQIDVERDSKWQTQSLLRHFEEKQAALQKGLELALQTVK
jgi:hypothetical protein